MNGLDLSRLRELVGDERRNFRNPDGTPRYEIVRGQLRRIGATDHCIVCGLPDHGGVLAFAHIHSKDLHFSPRNDPTRVFRLCWHHHHGCYDQNYISTLELLEAEAVWIANKDRPTPHPRDIELMRRVAEGEVVRDCYWNEPRRTRRSVFSPDASLQSLASNRNVKGSYRALMAHATRWRQRAAKSSIETEKASCLVRERDFLDRAAKLRGEYVRG